MTPSRFRGLFTACFAVLAGAACSGPGHGPVQAIPAAQPATVAPSRPAAIARARADSARYPYTEADIHFMSGMIGHHAQAIVMARWAPSHGAAPAVRTLAERIINAQQDEIAKMQTWLADRLQPVPEATSAGLKMTMNGVEHVMLMPGMLTEAQMRQLDQAKGPEFDRLFLIFMIQHHRGAVSMVEQLFGSHGAGQDLIVWKFASDVNIDQATEIARMEKMLIDLVISPK
jgi:uncharacterized protein (DUF305 family)